MSGDIEGTKRVRDSLDFTLKPLLDGFVEANMKKKHGNRWLLQEIKTRLPGRGLSLNVSTLTELLRETEAHHGEYEPTAPKHHWSGWYAAYIVARERGRTPDEAVKDATFHIEGAREPAQA